MVMSRNIGTDPQQRWLSSFREICLFGMSLLGVPSESSLKVALTYQPVCIGSARFTGRTDISRICLQIGA